MKMRSVQREEGGNILDGIIRSFRRHIAQRRETPSVIVRGHFSLTEIRGAKFPGHQTAATALCALLQAKCLSPSSWSPDVIDRLLLQGDKLHSMKMAHANSGNGNLSPDDLPRNFHTKHGVLTVTLNTVNCDVPLAERVDKPESIFEVKFRTLKNTLKKCLTKKHRGYLLTADGVTLGICSDGHLSYVFHPSLDKRKMFSSSRHEAALLHFHTLGRMCAFLCSGILSGCSEFSLRVVDILSDRETSPRSGQTEASEE